MNVGVTLTDLSQAVARKVREHVNHKVATLGGEVANAAKENLRMTTYRSKPGEAPYDAHGVLADSIEVQVGELLGEVTVSAPFAIYLELGTAKMTPRPFLLPAANQVFEKAEDGLTLGF